MSAFSEQLPPFVRKELDCDAQTPSIMFDHEKGRYVCRCMICARCRHHTGNSHQGHHWAYCKVTQTIREYHFCCPGTCELEEQQN